MGRRIITQTMVAETGALQGLNEPAKEQQLDKYADKLIKYIPADIIGAWLAAKGLIATAGDIPDKQPVLWISFAAGTILAFLWTMKQTSVPGHKPALTQSIISTVAFVVWVMAMGDPFTFSPLYGSLLLILFSLVIPLVNPPEN